MSFKDDIARGLEEYDIFDLRIDRDHTVNGVDSVLISFSRRANNTKYNHDFTFAKSNQMDAEHISTVVKSYLKNAPVGSL